MRRQHRWTAACLAAALVAAACSGGSKQVGPAQLDPAAAAGAVRALGRVQLDGSGAYGTEGETGPIDGVVQYSPRRTRVHFPVGADTVLANLEYRRIDNRAWVLTDESPRPPRLGFPLLAIRPPGYARPWLAIDPSSTGLQGVLPRPFDPADLLAALAQAKVKLARGGQAEVDGTRRARFVADIAKEQPGVLGVRELTVYTDEQGVPVRFELVTLSGVSAGYTIRAVEQTLAVEPPDPRRVELEEQIPTANGPYEEVAADTAGTVAYRVLRAPAAKGWSCWKVESDPAYVPTDTPGKDGGICIAGVTTAGDPINQVAFPLDASSRTPYEMLGLLVPPGTSVVMHLAGGTERTVPVPASGLAIDAGPPAPAAGLAVVTLPDGNVMYCAPGQINNLADLSGVDVAEGDSLRDQPWNCLEKELAESLGN